MLLDAIALTAPGAELATYDKFLFPFMWIIGWIMRGVHSCWLRDESRRGNWLGAFDCKACLYVLIPSYQAVKGFARHEFGAARMIIRVSTRVARPGATMMKMQERNQGGAA